MIKWRRINNQKPSISGRNKDALKKKNNNHKEAILRHNSKKTNPNFQLLHDKSLSTSPPSRPEKKSVSVYSTLIHSPAREGKKKIGKKGQNEVDEHRSLHERGAHAIRAVKKPT